jgi:hypothetical protein
MPDRATHLSIAHLAWHSQGQWLLVGGQAGALSIWSGVSKGLGFG